jgi:hypothetical protein
VFRKECGFDSLHGHQPSPLRGYGWQASLGDSGEAAKAARRSLAATTEYSCRGQENRCAAVLLPVMIGTTEEWSMANRMMTLTIAAGVLVAGLCFDATAGQAAYGDSPWCLVKTGDDAYWDCQYQTFQECLQARIGTGFCNVNPSGPSPAAQPQNQKRRS